MKWFKHDTGARRSETYKPIYRTFGFLRGYALCMCIQEIIAEKMDQTGRCHHEQDIKDWAKELGVKTKIFEAFLKHYENIPGILLKRFDNVIRIEIPNLLQKKDNYSKDLEVAGKPSISISISKINKQINKKENNGIIPQKIIDYLNSKTGRHFKAVPGNTKFIRARAKEGASESDFYKVIDFKFDQWEGTDWEKFIRPETLFSAQHFDSYLNEAILKNPKQQEQDRLAEIEEMKRATRERIEREKLETESKGH